MKKYKIIKNAAKCALCLDEIESKHRHDMVWCKCGAIAVDGGKDYMKCTGEPANFIDIAEYEVIED